MTEAQAIGRAQARELAHRETTHIQVTLLWNAADNVLTVRLVEVATRREYQFYVDPADALDAFNHPYAYLPTPPVPPMYVDVT